jgi:predicted RNA-binding Zn ribbon-like protein
MLFAHDTEVALATATALVNTGRGGREDLPDVEALDRFVGEWGWTGSRAHDQAELEAVRELRPRLARLWESGADQAAALVNTLLKEASALPQLVKHDGWDYHIHAVPADAPLADRMAVEAAMAFADVIRSGQLDRLRACAADDCGDLLVDLSKNRSRRFCSTTCANRVNVAAYRTRRSAGAALRGRRHDPLRITSLILVGPVAFLTLPRSHRYRQTWMECACTADLASGRGSPPRA